MTEESKNHLMDRATSEQLEAEVEAEMSKALEGQSMDQLMSDTAAKAPATPVESSSPEDPSSAPPPPAPAEDDDEPVKLNIKRGRISSIVGDDVFVELSGMAGKNQGLVPLTQFERPPRVGSIMDFVVDRIDETEGLAILSREGAVGRTTWDHLHQGSVVEARVTGTNKGGLELELVGRIRAFMPASQVDLHHVDDLEKYIGEKLVATVQEVNRRAKKVLLSRRRHLEHDRELKERRLWAELAVDQLREGVVSSVVPYGAFVDIGGIDGLIHISDMSYAHISKPEDAVKVGQKVQVKVLKLNAEKKRISLGLKQVQPDPWATLGERLKAGEKLSGRVMRVADFGAFVEVEPGVEGLLPVSELSWKRVHKPEEIVKVGDVVHLVVLTVDLERRRVSLSLKQSTGDPWVGAEHKYPKDSMVEGRVLSVTDFGAFAEIESGVEGMVHISELSPERVNAVTDVVQVGKSYSFRILEVDEDARRVRLSLKPAGSPAGSGGGGGGGGGEGRGGGRPQSSGRGRPSQREYTGPSEYTHKSKKTNRALKGGIE